MPHALIHDNDPLFTATVYNELLAALGIVPSCAPVYSHASRAELGNRHVLHLLRKVVFEEVQRLQCAPQCVHFPDRSRVAGLPPPLPSPVRVGVNAHSTHNVRYGSESAAVREFDRMLARVTFVLNSSLQKGRNSTTPASRMYSF